jgi:hypothetical protein
MFEDEKTIRHDFNQLISDQKKEKKIKKSQKHPKLYGFECF